MIPDQCQNWYEILLFIVSDFGAFLATVPVLPGSSFFLEAEMKICSLFSPYYSVGRSADCIYRGSIWAATPLQKAARSGALCIITRTKAWKPTSIDASAVSKEIQEAVAETEASLEGEDEHMAWHGSGLVDQKEFNIQGQIDLPEGYGIVRLHELEEVEELGSHEYRGKVPVIPCNYGILKTLIGVFQIVSGAAAYHKKPSGNTGTNQFDKRIFILVFIPYSLMSFINLLGSLISPQYPCMFMVESEVMDEARERGAFITGTVGRAKASTRVEDKSHTRARFVGKLHIRQPSVAERLSASLAIFLTISVVTVPFCIIAVLGAFSVFSGLTPHETVFYLLFLSWFGCSILYGLVIGTRIDQYSLVSYILNLNKSVISVGRRKIILNRFLSYARVTIFFCSAGVSIYLFYLIGYLIIHSEFCTPTD